MQSIVPIAEAKVDGAAFGRVLDPIIANIVNPILMLMFAVAIIVFIYGVVEMIAKGGDPSVREKGRWHMLGGVIGMVIMMSA